MWQKFETAPRDDKIAIIALTVDDMEPVVVAFCGSNDAHEWIDDHGKMWGAPAFSHWIEFPA